MSDYIEIKQARIHNLKNVDVKIPRNKLTVITGVSGSGKSSLAFDTLYEEGKRRYLMFSGTQFMIDGVPTFDKITGLSPTVAVEQRIIRQSNPRSTVGSRTKIGNMLAALYALCGEVDPEYDNGTTLTMEMFLQNSPKGMCVKCLGSGMIKFVDEEALYGDGSMMVEDVLEGKFKTIGSWHHRIKDYYKHLNVSPKQSLDSLTQEQLFALKYGSPKTSFPGVNFFVPKSFYQFNENLSDRQKLFVFQKQYAYQTHCPKCNGTGLGEVAAHTYLKGKNIFELEQMYIKELYEFLNTLVDIKKSPLLIEILTKLECMSDVGLHHLSLSRPVPTLSGGEIQRLFLASYIIAEMDSIIFVFDEPTIGLHEVEKAKLIKIIRNLVNRGNTVIAVEHDMNFMKEADYIIDLGPDAGFLGGEKVFEGTYKAFMTCNESKTAPYLRGEKPILPYKKERVVDPSRYLTIEGANLHNLKNVTVDIPLGLMVGISGVSGSGKSSLISDTLVPKLKEQLKSKCVTGDPEDEEEVEEPEMMSTLLKGVKHIKKCIVIDQKPIGRSRTSCPATYTGMFDKIRDMFANTEFAKEKGYTKGMFSVNSDGGCRKCKGEGVIHYYVGYGNHMEMECDQCGGYGYIPEAMEVTLDGKTIRDVLEMTVDEAISFLKGKDKSVEIILETLRRVGMGYIQLGQKTPTISGGESQRVKLATELSKASGGKAQSNIVYILDEPTTGLAYHDSERLMKLLQELVDGGNSVIITEHDPFVLGSCDYIIELGVGGGRDGGNIIAYGTPSALKSNPSSIIGRYL